MAVVASFYEDEYLPEFGTVVLRSGSLSSIVSQRAHSAESLSEHFSDASPCGTFARSGAGWLQLRADDNWHAVLLESHDAEPLPIDADELMELPFLQLTDAMALDSMTGSDVQPVLALDPGLHRVRVARSVDQRGPRWIVQLWPAPADETLPRWLRRGTQFTDSEDAPGDLQAARATHGPLAADLVLVAAWPGGAAVTLDDLAERMVLPRARLRAALQYAVDQGLVAVDGRVSDGSAAVTLLALPGAAHRRAAARRAELEAKRRRAHSLAPELATRPAQPVARVTNFRQSATAGLAVRNGTAGSPWRAGLRIDTLPIGEPPAAGIVTRLGEVAIWREGRQQTLAELGKASWERAFDTPHGIVVISTARTVLVRWSGHVDTVVAGPALRGAVSTDGEVLAVEEFHVGRTSWAQLHRIALADLSRQSLPTANGYGLLGMHGGDIYYYDTDVTPTTMLWPAGQPPKPLAHRVRDVDAITGALVVVDGAGPRRLLLRPDRQPVRVPANELARLSPGARWFYTNRHLNGAQQRVEFYAADEPDGAPVAVDLPAGVRADVYPPTGISPVWESRTALLMIAETAVPGIGAVRLHVDTGAMECVPITGDRYRPTLITPLLEPDNGATTSAV